MKIAKSEIIKKTTTENGIRVIFQHEDEDSTIYGPYIINRANSKGIDEVIERHGYYLELQYNFESDPEEEKKALIDNLLQYDDSIIKEVLDLSDKEVSALRDELISKKESKFPVDDPGVEPGELEDGRDDGQGKEPSELP